MAEALRCALFGAGMMGRNHARVIRETPGIELSVLVDPAGDRHGLRQDLPFFSSVSDALELGIDCAIIAVPTHVHEEISITLALNGVPCLIEKPLAHSSDAGKRIAQAFASSGTFAAVAHTERFNPAVRELRRRLTGGDLGEVFQIATRRQSSFPLRIADVGVALDLGSHDIDLTTFISSSNYDYVSAVATNRSGRRDEDMIVCNGKLENGAVVSHIVNWLSPLKERTVVVYGEYGLFAADLLTGDLTLHQNGQHNLEWDSLTGFRGVSEGEITRFAYSKKEPLRAQLEGFIRALNFGELGELALIRDGLGVLTVIDRMLESASTRTVLSVDF